MDGNKEKRNLESVVMPPATEEWIHAFKCSYCDCLITDKYLMCELEGHLTCEQCVLNNPTLECNFPINDINHDENSTTHICTCLKRVNLEEGIVGEVTANKPLESSKTNAGDQNINQAGPNDSLKLTAAHETPCTDIGEEEAKGQGSTPTPLKVGTINDNGRKSICGAHLTKRSHIFVDRLLENTTYHCSYSDNGCKMLLSAKNMKSHCNYCVFKVKNMADAEGNDADDQTII